MRVYLCFVPDSPVEKVIFVGSNSCKSNFDTWVLFGFKGLPHCAFFALVFVLVSSNLILWLAAVVIVPKIIFHYWQSLQIVLFYVIVPIKRLFMLVEKPTLGFQTHFITHKIWFWKRAEKGRIRTFFIFFFFLFLLILLSDFNVFSN